MQRDTWGRYNIQMYPLKDQDVKRDRMWADIKAMADGKMDIEHLLHTHTERAEIIIASVWMGSNHYDYAVNIPNTPGYISNMPRNAIVEVPSVMGNHGIMGIAVGDLAPVVASFCNKQKDIVDLAVAAMVEGNRSLALQALALDPMIDDLDVARHILNDGLVNFKDYLPQFYK